MQTIQSSRCSSPAFTRTDLLTLVVAIGGLAALALPVAAKSFQRTLTAQCAANLRQFGMATHLYAAENRDLLPASSGTGFTWAWDLPRSLADSLQSRGFTREAFYCPSILADAEAISVESWWASFAGTTVLGYAHTFNTGTSVQATNLNRSVTPRPITATPAPMPAPSPSQRVMLADAVLSSGANVENPTENNYFVSGGLGIHSPAHMDGVLPSGGNVAMLDGRVVWRSFAEMQPRTTSIPTFWW